MPRKAGGITSTGTPSSKSPDLRATITSVSPLRACGGGRITIHGQGFDADSLIEASVGGAPARVSFVSSTRVIVTVPAELDGGPSPVRISDVPGETAYVSIGAIAATGLHQVDNPLFDRDGNLFVTYSGSRGQEAPVSIFRVTPAGTREPFVSGIVNATSMVFGPDERLYVSSRFDGAVYTVEADGTYEQVATDLGVACGIAFDRDGWMYVGDRSGTIFRVRDGRATAFASLPPSVAAFHLAMSPEGELFVSAPTLGSYDYVHRIDRHGRVQTLGVAMGRPQGLTFGPDGALYVIDALAGASGLYRVPLDGHAPELIVSGAALVGIAFGAAGQIAVCSNETAYRFD
jgi:sugar lactone lactonase YvrE